MYPGGLIPGIIYSLANGWVYIRGGLKPGGLKVGFYGMSPGGVLPSKRIMGMCRWMGSQRVHKPLLL